MKNEDVCKAVDNHDRLVKALKEILKGFGRYDQNYFKSLEAKLCPDVDAPVRL